MKKNITVLLLFTLLILSCKKNGDLQFSINGIVTDESFSTGLSGATVIVYEKPVANFNYQEIGRTTADSEGKYSILFPRNRVENYKIIIRKDNYFDKEYQILYSALDPKKSIEYNFGTTAYSWVKIHLKNVNEINDYDGFIYKKTQGKTDCETCCPTGEEIHLYGNADTIFYCMTDGNKPFAYFYELQNTSTIGTVQQNTVAFDTITLVTEY